MFRRQSRGLQRLTYGGVDVWTYTTLPSYIWCRSGETHNPQCRLYMQRLDAVVVDLSLYSRTVCSKISVAFCTRLILRLGGVGQHIPCRRTLTESDGWTNVRPASVTVNDIMWWMTFTWYSQYRMERCPVWKCGIFIALKKSPIVAEILPISLLRQEHWATLHLSIAPILLIK